MTDDGTAPLSFGRRLRQLRQSRDALGLRPFGKLVYVSHTWLAQVETGQVPPTIDLAQRCDAILDAGGELVALAARELAAQRGWPRPAQLPAAAAGRLVGRDIELSGLEDLLVGRARPPGTVVMAVVDGPAGTGKTALAQAAGHRVADHHVDGVLYRDLQGYAPDREPADPGQVLEEFLHALGVGSADLPLGVAERTALFRSLTHGRALLVVLDNARDVAQVEPLLPNAVGSSVIVTSRRSLSSLVRTAGAVRLSLGPLDERHAVELLGSIIGAARVDAEPDAAAELARTCGLLPLALCIAAERVDHRRFHSLRELTAEIDEPALLEAPGVEAGAGNAAHAVFSWSYRALSGEQARAFRLLGLHPGVEIGTCAAAAMLKVSPAESRTLLEDLGRVHLIAEVARDRWRFHDLLRTYARSLLDEEPRQHLDDAMLRLVSWYVHTSYAAERALAPQRTTNLVVEPHGDDVCPMSFGTEGDARAWYATEEPNFVPVIALAVRHELNAWAWQLPVTLWGWLLLKQPTELWLATHHLGIDAAKASDDAYGEGWVLANLAFLLRTRREYDAAERAVRRSLELRERVEDRHGQAWSTAGLGFLAVDRGRAAEALTYFRRALALFADTEDLPHGASIVLASMGEAHADLSEVDQARACWDDALAAFLALGDAYGQAWTLARRGQFEGTLGHYPDAVDALEASLALRMQVGDLAGQAQSLKALGDVHHRSGDLVLARTTWSQALTHFRQLGDPNAGDVADRLAALAEGPGP